MNPRPQRYLREAAARFQKETSDTRIDVFFFDCLGAKGHPTAAQARTMAEKNSRHF